MKKNNFYTAPELRIVEVTIGQHLLDASVTGVSMSGFSEDLTVGGETETADSRRNVWEED
jgi:hypothetical protein